MLSSAIRSSFVGYFRSQSHTHVPSSSLVPAGDQTLLFTNSGMVQFKDVFLGVQPSKYDRALTAQRCLRAGGKHNDLENVGYTARHHTFFEMMGNFSFADYFKEDAIAFAWEYVTKVLNLPEEKLWVTVHESDKEAEDIWFNKMGISKERFSRLDEDNFWSMGSTGPCGPCSEIFYDHGPDVAGGPPGSPDEDGDRYVEIWNLVFMQYNRNNKGAFTELKKPSIDTGMGLERVAAVLQGVVSNYDTDLFRPIIAKASDLLHCDEVDNPSLKVIADHIRACTFLLFDGVSPSNEGRGYVLRRIIRRAIRHGYSLGSQDIFFSKLLPTLIATMEQYSTELNLHSKRITQILDGEEKQFRNTLEQGMNLLDRYLDTHSGRSIAGDTVFRLYDTFGFPVDLTNDIARERGLQLDMDGFDACMKQQQQQSKQSHSFHTGGIDVPNIDAESDFTGYRHMFEETEVLALVRDGKQVDNLVQQEQAWVLLAKTPFYAESGGQVGDSGTIISGTSTAEVGDTLKHGGQHWHFIEMTTGTLATGDKVQADVDNKRRYAIMRNHSATHLLHASLRRHLGDTVMQKGSLVTQDKLRFDFSHNSPVTREQLRAIENQVNEQILLNTPVRVQEMAMDAAKQTGAIAFFDEKYGDTVRVLSMGEMDKTSYSVELCGGTHVHRTGDIGSLHIIQETGIASGIRRIEAVTALGAQSWLQDMESTMQDTTALLKTDSNNLLSAVTNVLEQNKKLNKELQTLQATLATGTSQGQDVQAVTIAGVQAIIRRVDNVNTGALRTALDNYKSQLGEGVVLLAGAHNSKVAMVAGVTNNLTEKISAQVWLQSLADIVDGKAGGRPDMAQGGGSHVGAIDTLLQQASSQLEQLVQGES